MKSIIENLRLKLAKTKNGFVAKLAEAVNIRRKIDEDMMEELEEILIEADLGAAVSEIIIDRLREKIRVDNISDSALILPALKNIIGILLGNEYSHTEDLVNFNNTRPVVILFVGVNGVGKTTTIGKLAKQYSDQGKSVMMIAADTFRAAAIEQLTIWSERASVLLHKQTHGSDPSAVIYDGLTAAISRKVDIVLIDTAGRLHNKVNLMNELGKMRKTIQKVIPSAPHRTLLVVDASTGQNAINQAKLFNEIAQVDGIVLTKLDGTAKGGIVIGIKHNLNIPVLLIGIGEGIDDLKPFNPDDFTEAIFSA